MATPKNSAIVKESNIVARAKIEPKAINVWEERIIALILSKIRIEDKVFHEHTFSFIDICQDERKLNGHEYLQLKKAVESLAKKIYIIPNETRGIKAFPIFAHIDINDAGDITAKMNPELCNHYLELKGQFALRSLPEFQSLSGIYAQQLFRYLNSWRSVTEKIVSIRELQEFLSVPKSMSVNYAHFRRFVLEIAAAEINAKTSLKFTWSPIISRGRGHRVEAIAFVFDQPKAKVAPISATAAKAPAKKHPVFTAPPAPAPMTPEERAEVAAKLAAFKAGMFAPPEDRFISAANELSQERDFIRICDLRARLGWTSVDFDAIIRKLRDAGTIQLHAGNVTTQTPDEVNDGFVDENGYRMGNITITAQDGDAPSECPSTPRGGGGGNQDDQQPPKSPENGQKKQGRVVKQSKTDAAEKRAKEATQLRKYIYKIN